jgi:hypothetical protein
MDWLAGSRQHLLELLLTRTLVLAPIFVLGFSKDVIDAYIVVVGFQAVFNHANVSVRLGPLRYLIVTPNFHHWHHSQDDEAIDRTTRALRVPRPPVRHRGAVRPHLAATVRRGRRLRAERLLKQLQVPVHLEGLIQRGSARSPPCAAPARTTTTVHRPGVSELCSATTPISGGPAIMPR